MIQTVEGNISQCKKGKSGCKPALNDFRVRNVKVLQSVLACSNVLSFSVLQHDAGLMLVMQILNKYKINLHIGH